jgi:L-alanine-DL-glutamate epimerase-like enolase superfamily enzyme
MNRHGDRHMDRRVFLKGASCAASAALWSSLASGRHLVLIETSESERISRIEWVPYDTGTRGPDERPVKRCAVRVTTSSGAQGWADLSIWAFPDAATQLEISDTLLGQAPADHDSLWRRFYEQGLALEHLAAVDVALWDLRGRMAGQPVHALLGAKREKVKTYLSTGHNFGEPESYAQYAAECKEAGVGGIKIQPYVEWGAGLNDVADAGFPDKDMAAYSAVREAVGAGYACMADNGGTYTLDEALRVGRLLDDLGYAWYESPMPETDEWVDRYATLVRELRTPICGPESHPGSFAARVAWMETGACDVARISVYHGGFSACLQLASACEGAGIGLELHNTGADSYGDLQLIASTTEAVIGRREILSLSREPRVLPGRTAPEPVFDADGYLAIPTTPGMGVELDWQYIFRHRMG